MVVSWKLTPFLVFLRVFSCCLEYKFKEANLGLQDILDKIKAETELKKQEILGKANAERDKILKEAEERAKEILKKAEEEKQKRVKQRVNALIADYVIESNIRLEQVKREALDRLYGEVLKEVKTDQEKYKSLILYLFGSVGLDGNEEIFVGEGEKFITKAFIDDLNKKNNWNLTLSNKNVKIQGGFIAKGKKSRIDASLEKIMEILQEETEVQVSEMLFK